MGDTIDLLITLIRSEFTGEKIESKEDYSLSFDSVMKLAQTYDIAHLAADAMMKNGILDDPEKLEIARKLIFHASYRDTKNEFTCRLASRVLSDEQIPFILLKGVILKKLYPYSWMRSSCDIDILIHEENLNNAIKALKDNGFGFDKKFNFHDATLFFEDTNLELHFSICEDNKTLDFLLKDVWKYTVHHDGFEYRETNDFFVFHHIAHMVHHFLSGGCGIRPFIDLWLLRNSGFFDDQKVREFCEIAKITDFYDAVNDVTDVWFNKKEHTDVTKRIQKYILTGGAYGHYPNSAAAYTVKHGSKLGYILSLAFPDYDSMRSVYPVLNKAPFFLPFCYVARVFDKTLGSGSAGAKKRFEVIKNQDDDFLQEVASLIKTLNLDK